MNYKLIMTEETVELSFLEVLLEKDLLMFNKDELLAEKIFHQRQINGEIMGFIQMLPMSDSVTIYRVGDKLSDALKIPKQILPSKIKQIVDVLTTPEFEILFIIKENLFDKYIKCKTKIKPSIFYKMHNNEYKKQSKFITDYFYSMSNQDIIELLNEYVKKRGKIHKDKFNLRDIIKLN